MQKTCGDGNLKRMVCSISGVHSAPIAVPLPCRRFAAAVAASLSISSNILFNTLLCRILFVQQSDRESPKMAPGQSKAVFVGNIPFSKLQWFYEYRAQTNTYRP